MRYLAQDVRDTGKPALQHSASPLTGEVQMEIAVNKQELKTLNTELVDLLTTLRDIIDQQLDDLEAAQDDDANGDDEEDDEADDDDPALEENGED